MTRLGILILGATLCLSRPAAASDPVRTTLDGETSKAHAANGKAKRIKSPRKGKKKPAKGKGRLRVVIDGGWGTVTINGRDAGKTPLSQEIAPGLKIIYVYPFGKAPHVRREVTVKSGAEAVVRLKMAAQNDENER